MYSNRDAVIVLYQYSNTFHIVRTTLELSHAPRIESIPDGCSPSSECTRDVALAWAFGPVRPVVPKVAIDDPRRLVKLKTVLVAQLEVRLHPCGPVRGLRVQQRVDLGEP
jgi:hypothetical protein